MRIINKILKFFHLDYRIISKNNLENTLVEIYTKKVTTKEQLTEKIKIIYTLPRSKAERQGKKLPEDVHIKNHKIYHGKKSVDFVEFPCKSGKKSFRGKKSAEKASKIFSNFKHGSKDRQRVYKCWDCPYWHLTSQ